MGMKLRLTITFTVTALWFWGCDACKDVECRNGGQCDEGSCVCAEWFTGPECADAVIGNFAGWYDITYTCDDTEWFTDRARVIYVDPQTLRLGQMRMTFRNQYDFEIEEQQDDYNNTYSGAGSFSSRAFTFELTITYPGGGQDHCTYQGAI